MTVGSMPLGVGVATGEIVAVVRVNPRLARSLIRGIRSAPERMLRGSLNNIERKTGSRSDLLL